MPIYEYSCPGCSAEFELLVRSAGDRVACPECGSEKLDKRFSVPAAHTSSGGTLPVRPSEPGGTCGRPQCGGGFCAGLP